MGRKKRKGYKYENTPFAVRIREQQASNGYKDREVMELLAKENYFIENVQTYQSYKSGKRRPGDFDEAVAAFSKIYNVSADYLLGMSDTPNLTFEKAHVATGLSIESIKALVNAGKAFPGLVELTDAVISGMEGEGVLQYYNIYQQMYSDYCDSAKAEYYRKFLNSGDSVKEAEAQSFLNESKMKEMARFYCIQNFYEYCYNAAVSRMSKTFDMMLENESYNAMYENSPEAIAARQKAMEESDRYLAEQGLIEPPKVTVHHVEE